jgi:hypothetical protein
MSKKESNDSKKKKEQSQSENNMNILVVGDWVIDEDWVMMPERSETSAKQSEEKHFYTAFNDLNVATKRLCGASLTASAIKGYIDLNEIVGVNVFGMGVWNPDDDDYLEQLFQEDALPGSNPFQISEPKKTRTDKNEKNLFNLAREGDICSTTRIVRTFMGHPGTLLKSMSRYDWHVEWKPGPKDSPLKDTIEKRIQENLDEMKRRGVVLDAIVLADFNKGLITEDLIKSLTKKTIELKSKSGLTWYYRSKQLIPPTWYSYLSENMRNTDEFIQFIDPRIAKKYADGKPLIYGSGITPDGLKFLKQYISDVPRPKMATLFHDNSCIAYDAGEAPEKSMVWALRSNEEPTYITRGRSSIFLASLVVMHLGNKKNFFIDKGYNLGHNCAVALSNGIKWCHDCLSIWNTGENISQVSANIRKAIHFTKPGSNIKISKALSWEEYNEKWESAKKKDYSGCIKKNNNNLQLEVWRAHTILNDYTVIDDDRKKSILNLTNIIQSFLELDEKDKKRPLISLVKAGPGSGKTFLAKCLSRQYNLELFECNVAQLTSLEGLTHFFDQVDTAQRDGRRVFMFLDEVDSLVNGESPFGFLLEMMWCGQYYRNGMKNMLKPFPGIFALSRDYDNEKFQKDHPKFPDLESRVYGINFELKNFTELESVYLFAKLVDKYFGQIESVEKGVLEIISRTELKYGPRSLELLISLFKEIKRNIVTFDNLPSKDRIKELKEHFPNGLFEHRHYGKNEKTMVKLIYTPPMFE